MQICTYTREFTAGQKNREKLGQGLRVAGPSRAVGRGRGPAFSKTRFFCGGAISCATAFLIAH